MIERRVVSYYFSAPLPYHVTLVRVNYEISRHNFPLRSFHTVCVVSGHLTIFGQVASNGRSVPEAVKTEN